MTKNEMAELIKTMQGDLAQSRIYRVAPTILTPDQHREYLAYLTACDRYILGHLKYIRAKAQA